MMLGINRGEITPLNQLQRSILIYLPDRKPVSIYASVTRGYAPVVNAKVFATIESPTAKFVPIVVELRDDGVAADMNKDDGVYSVAILNAKVEGKHSISVNVNGNDQANVKSVRYSGAASITGKYSAMSYY